MPKITRIQQDSDMDLCISNRYLYRSQEVVFRDCSIPRLIVTCESPTRAVDRLPQRRPFERGFRIEQKQFKNVALWSFSQNPSRLVMA